MSTVIWIVLGVLIVLGILYTVRRGGTNRAQELADAQAEARRWVERLGGQVYAIDPGDDKAARQALADASERYTAAGSQVDQATSVQQYRLAQQTAYEGLYFIGAARTALGMDPGPALPPIPGQQQAGQVTEDRSVEVEGHGYEASPQPSDRTPNYYPGGMVAGKPVPRGWYSEPWWKPALVAGAWGVGTYLVASTLFAGMAGMGGAWAYDAGYDQGLQDAGGDGSGDYGSGDGSGDYGDQGGDYSGGDYGGDFGGGSDFGGDFGGGDFGDF
ncbi:hypothetical protein GIS00_05545 [Nakamurella sp. YIM 132087]|uniref:DUF1542 domain-containing protein n=1 Tax=Nakamurella alba TaxID=2665158 RepID=A0A7K1FGZ9_9ACTN|nr:hypothetical protein [Nakamurella alba]MTD13407.1 hypothetical protein [Nakamurella alba]